MAQDQTVPHNFHVTVDSTEGRKAHLTVKLDETIPVGGLTLAVVWDKEAGRIVSVSPWRNLGQFVIGEIARQTGSKVAH
jgi:hypothetical protein